MAVKTSTADLQKTNYEICDTAPEQMEDSESSYCKVKHLSRDVTSDGFERKTRGCKRNAAAVVLIVSLGINVLAVVYVLNYVQHESGARPHAEARVSGGHENTVCTDCRSLGVNLDRRKSTLHELHVHHVTGSSSLCCLRNAEGLWRLASIFANRFHTETRGDAFSSSARTSPKQTGAHLYVDSEALKLQPPSMSWNQKYGQNSAYISSDIESDGQNLHITRPGLYHVYSFFTFKTKQRRRRPEFILHTINRTNAHLSNIGSPVILMATKTMPEVSERFVTSYLSATIRLRQNDDLFVHVSNLSYVYEYPPSNFLGLYYLGT
ncbi:uncharacterized protein LOC124125192 [Haliotis rufescens]|uniref:uncharacterized protein LOC124125192 n=1 Tax=Haliotis rufescens TaxID=6454 RepID=UPI00201F5821|nr:uncharacterized protein LOC124125192 [Haliotis rufescens]